METVKTNAFALQLHSFSGLFYPEGDTTCAQRQRTEKPDLLREREGGGGGEREGGGEGGREGGRERGGSGGETCLTKCL